MNEQSAPVNVGETYEVTISAVGEKGDGIARVKGFVLFVPGVKKGDYVKLKITKVLKSVGFAEVIERLERLPKESKFATVSAEEFDEPEEELESQYEETEDFGDDIEEK
ncbi:MAG: TRAM domain-containing protein [Nanoarchaeota archaeon]|nr:TRAM domain-containing protein [Nanoarchaeota archaeon]MBU1631590.1 TRAM domain-containing protein [Nanoarchaeota archaeon]MBU1875480.1 TRAM domain-containing protein [Nanoarchaeota archaeon]